MTALVSGVAGGVFGAIAQASGHQLPGGMGPDSATLETGARDLLSVGMTEAIKVVALENGYFSNQFIKILLPDKWKPIVSIISKLGLQKKLDKLVLSMNRAAERAAASALNIFHHFIRGIHFSDLKTILFGGETAATDFFKSRTERDLTEAYKPVVTTAMNEWQVTRHYSELSHHVEHVPLVKDFAINIEDYTVSRSLHGLFWMLAEKEKAVRNDPRLRVTKALQEIFH